MVISRMRPCANWLRLPAHETRRALNKVLDFRDKSADPTVSGMPPAAVEWFYSEELPRLCTRPGCACRYRSRFKNYCNRLPR